MMTAEFMIGILIPAGLWFLIGLRFAYKFLQDNLHQHSTFGDLIDLSIAGVFIVAIWPVLMVTKLVKEY